MSEKYKTAKQQLSVAKNLYEPSNEIMVLFVLRKLILQTRMRSHPGRLDVWFLVGFFADFHTSTVRMARWRGCAGSSEPSLVACVISTKIPWVGSYEHYKGG